MQEKWNTQYSRNVQQNKYYMRSLFALLDVKMEIMGPQA